MPDPQGIKTVTLHGLFVMPDLVGTPLQGTITFTPTPSVVTFPDQKVIVTGTETATLDVNGAFSIDLICTDTLNEQPTNWTYAVTERLIGQKPRSYQIALPYTTALMELAQITPTEVQPTYVPVIGPPGVIQTINGHSAATVNLTAADVSAVATSQLGAASGVATLDATSHLTAAQLPTNVITQGSGDVRYIQVSAEGVANGVATLDATTRLPAAQLPTTAIVSSQVGAASGVASLDAGIKVPVAQIPDLSTTYAVNTKIGAASGIASLDGTTRLPVAQLPTSAITQTSGDTRYAQLTTTAREDLGLYVPPAWGQFWKPKRNGAGTAKATIAAVGSSSTQGLYSSNLLTAPWASKLMTNLQTTYGDGGSGYFHTARSLTFMGAGTVTNAWNAISGNFCTVTGTWTVGNPYGPGANYLYTTNVGDTITFIIRGTTARIYTVSGAGRSNWSYTVDGGASTPVTDSGTGGSTIQVTNITGLTSGSHTLVLTKAGAGGSSFAPCGVTGENATGIILNNFGMSGAMTRDINGFTNNYDPGRWTGGPDYPADLLIYTLGANDCNVGYTGDTWAANLDQFLQGVKAGSTVGGTAATGNTDVLIMMQHIGNYDPNYKWQDYCGRARVIAEAYGAALVNIWPMGRNAWPYWNTLNYWGNGTTAGGVAGTDSVHMSDAGHTAVYNALQPIITAA